VQEHVPKAEQDALVVIGHLQVMFLQVLLGTGDEVLVAVLDELDGPVEQLRQPRDDDLLGVLARLRAEPAAHVRWRDHADPFLGQSVAVRHLGPDLVGGLRGVPDEELAHAAVVAGRNRAALHRVATSAVDRVGLPQHPRRLREGGVDVAGGLHDVGRHVVVDAIVDRDRQLLGDGEVARSGQRLVVDLDELAGVFGEIAALGDDHGDQLADVADLLDRQRPLLGGPQRCVRQVHRPRPVDLFEVGRRVHPHDPFGRSGSRGVDAQDPRVRDGAAHGRHVHDARQVDVVDVLSASAQQPQVLAPHPALADHRATCAPRAAPSEAALRSDSARAAWTSCW
jgi:hypothetical protein